MSSLSLYLPSVHSVQVVEEDGCWPGGQEGALAIERSVLVQEPPQLIVHDPVGGVWEVDVM